MNLNYSIEELASIWNKINEWEWDDRLGDKPKNWDSLPEHSLELNIETKMNHIRPVAKRIEDKIGIKNCLRWHHLNNLNRSNDEFENWWKRYSIRSK